VPVAPTGSAQVVRTLSTCSIGGGRSDAPHPASTAAHRHHAAGPGQQVSFTVSSRKKPAVPKAPQQRQPAVARQHQQVARFGRDRAGGDGLAQAGGGVRQVVAALLHFARQFRAGPTADWRACCAGCCGCRSLRTAAIPASAFHGLPTGARAGAACARRRRRTAHAGGEHEGADRRQQVQAIPAHLRRIGVDAARHAQQAGDVHREEGRLKPPNISRTPSAPALGQRWPFTSGSQ
jgi:hypothetical protein